MSVTHNKSSISMVRVIHTFQGNTAIYWETDRTELYGGNVTIEWARTPNGTWHMVDGAIISADGMAIDPKKRLYGKEKDLYYRVRVDMGGAYVYSFPAQVGYDYRKDTWLKYKEVLRLAELTYKQNPLAINVCLLKRRIYGPRCPVCRDGPSGVKVNSQCLTCFGTQVVRGYYPAYPLRMLEGQITRKYSWANEMSGMDNQQRRQGSVVSYPVLIDERDVLVNVSSGERFLIAGLSTSGIVNHVQIGNLVVIQQFDFDIISSENVVYKVPLDGCGALGQWEPEVDPCAEPEEVDDGCGLQAESEERPVFQDVPVIPEPPPTPEKDGDELIWPGYY